MEKYFVHQEKRGHLYKQIISLLDVCLLKTGYQLGINVENFHTSPSLFEELSQLQIGACGTVSQTEAAFQKQLLMTSQRE